MHHIIINNIYYYLNDSFVFVPHKKIELVLFENNTPSIFLFVPHKKIELVLFKNNTPSIFLFVPHKKIEKNTPV
jgi:hypothetical protein